MGRSMRKWRVEDSAELYNINNWVTLMMLESL